MKSMKDLMLQFLQDIYYAERLSVKSYLKLVKSVRNDQLKQAFQEHKEQSEQQVERLKDVFEAMGKRAKGRTSAAMDGLVEECKEAIEDTEPGPVLDAALIACAQAIEHYEMARYGAMAGWAKQLGQDDVAQMLQKTLDEEKAFSGRLTKIAAQSMTQGAENSGKQDGHEDEKTEAEAEAPADKPKAKSKKK